MNNFYETCVVIFKIQIQPILIHLLTHNQTFNLCDKYAVYSIGS